MNFGDPALVMGIAKTSRGLSRLLVTNGVFAIMIVLLLLGSFTLQLAREHSVSRNGAPAGGE